MYLLRFLEGRSALIGREIADRVTVEYRLACSGELYNRKVITAGGWRKSDVTRVLLRTPLELFVASQPFAAYPQELCVRLDLSYVTESHGGKISSIRTFLSDEDIVEDLSSILSLLSRRLISPGSKTREQHSDPQLALGSYGSDFPMPVLSAAPIAVWAQRPATIVYRPQRPRSNRQ